MSHSRASTLYGQSMTLCSLLLAVNTALFVGKSLCSFCGHAVWPLGRVGLLVLERRGVDNFLPIIHLQAYNDVIRCREMSIMSYSQRQTFDHPLNNFIIQDISATYFSVDFF